MYEHFRNAFLTAAHDAKLPVDMLEAAVKILDTVAERYDVRPRELALAPYACGEVPEIVKIYLVCKRIEGLSEQTLKTYMQHLRLFFAAMMKPLPEITANDIRVYLFRYQRERGCSDRSLDKYRGYFFSFFSWATDEGYLERNPMRTIPPIKYEKKPRQHLTQLELEYLRCACRTPRDKAVVEILYSTGCRVAELAAIKLSDIDWNSGSVHLFGKGKKHRDSFLNAKAEVAVRAYLATRNDDCPYLIVSERKPYRPLKTAAIQKIVRKLAERVSGQIPKPVTPHVLRHTTATTALQSGMPITDISRLLGHSKIDTTLVYAHTSLVDVQNGHRKHVV